MLALLALAAAALSACAPSPEPTPTPTAAFASEEEAFAAAEEVYRAYLLAAAQQAAGNETADPQSFLVGRALESDLASQRALKDQGISIIGASLVETFTPIEADVSGQVATVRADICVDISASRVKDADNKDITPSDRADTGQLTVEFSGTADKLLVSDSSPGEGNRC